MTWAVALGITLGLGAWSLVSLAPRMSRPRLARRVAPYLADVSDAAREAMAPPTAGPVPVLGLLGAPGRRLIDAMLGDADATARRLRQAARPYDLAAFRSRQLLAALGAAVVGAGIALVLPAPLPVRVGVVALAGVVGVLAPDQLLRRAAARRLARLDEELPVILEFLALSLSAGEGVVDALRRVSRVGRGELARELAAVVASVGTGLPFADTLTALARDLDLPAFTRCVDQLLAALERGTPLVDVLRAQAQDARTEAKRRLIESGGTKEIAMLVPLVFLILPVTIVFAVWPALLVLELGR